MGSTGLVNVLLTTLCSNYNSNNETESFLCTLKSDDQLKREVLRGKKIRIATFDDPPLSYVEEGPNGELFGKGVVFEVIETLREIYGFTYELVKMPRVLGDETSGILGTVAAQDVDMAAGFLPVLPGTHNYITWGTELWQNTYYVLMKRPAESASSSSLLAPFDTEVWLLILVSLLAVGPIMYGIMWLRVKLCNDHDIQIFPLSSCVWFVYGALMKQGSTLNPATDSSRMLFATWWLFILILTAFYTANLTAFLTLSQFSLPINDIEDVAKPPNKWLAFKGGSVEYSIKSKDDGDLHVLLDSIDKGYGRFIDPKPESVILQMVTEGWLFLDDWFTLTRYMFQDYLAKTEKGIDESSRCTYVLTKNEFLMRSLAFAYPLGSGLPVLFNPTVQHFVESGILKHLLFVDLPEATVCPLNLGNKERKLRNSDLFTTYAVVLSGFTCALAVFCGEIIWRKFLSPSRKRDANATSVFDKNLQFASNLRIDKMKALKNQIHTKINGRDYFVITGKDGDTRFIPLRTPSALLFQYA